MATSSGRSSGARWPEPGSTTRVAPGIRCAISSESLTGVMASSDPTRTSAGTRMVASVAVESGRAAIARNAPTTPAADAILRDRGVLVVPDIQGAAGGMVLAYFEWVQDVQSFFWTEEEIAADLERIMDDAFGDVLAMSEAKSVDLGGKVTLELVKLPPGEFLMGSTPEEKAWATGIEGGATPGTSRESFEGEAPRPRHRLEGDAAIAEQRCERGIARRLLSQGIRVVGFRGERLAGRRFVVQDGLVPGRPAGRSAGRRRRCPRPRRC